MLNMITGIISSDLRLIFEGKLFLKPAKGEVVLRQACLYRDPRRNPCLKFFRVNDRTRLAPIFSCVFEPKTVVQSAPADAADKDQGDWILISTDGVEFAMRAGKDYQTDVWKDALTAAMVLTALIESMKTDTLLTASAAGRGTVILKSVYMLKAPNEKNVFRPWYEVKRMPTSDCRRSLVRQSPKHLREVFFDPKLELHQGDLVLVIDRSCEDIKGVEKFHMIKLRSPHNYGYINANLLQAAFLPESQAGLLKLLTPSVRKFLLHGTLADVASAQLVQLRRGPSTHVRQIKTPTPRTGKSFFAADAPRRGTYDYASSAAASGAKALPLFSKSGELPPSPHSSLTMHRKRSLSTDDSPARQSKGASSTKAKSRPSSTPAAAAAAASLSSKASSSKGRGVKSQSAGNLQMLTLSRSRPRLKSNVRTQYLVRIAIETQLKNKKGLAAHGQKWLKTIKGQMEKFKHVHGPCQKRLYEALERTPAERRQCGELLDEDGKTLDEDAIKKLLTEALAEIPDM